MTGAQIRRYWWQMERSLKCRWGQGEEKIKHLIRSVIQRLLKQTFVLEPPDTEPSACNRGLYVLPEKIAFF